MGCGASAVPEGADPAKFEAQKQFTRTVDRKVEGLKQADSRVRKLLLLGAGESGKSTLFKQFTALYGQGITEDERRLARVPVMLNTLMSIQKLIGMAQGPFGYELGPDVAPYAQVLSQVKPDTEISADMAAAIQRVWADPAIQRAWERRSEFQIVEMAPYFFDRAEAIAAHGYIPTEDDFVRVRVRTTGITEQMFQIDGVQFKTVDVGGQRNERKKWIHCFDSVTAVIFVVALSEYDQTIFEDEKTNRMIESLSLFEEIVNSKWFRDASVILFLNKRDLFEGKVRRSPIAAHFSDYQGSQDSPEEGIRFFTDKFLSRNQNPSQKIVFTQVCTATDRSNVDFVFNAVKSTIISNTLAGSGLLND